MIDQRQIVELTLVFLSFLWVLTTSRSAIGAFWKLSPTIRASIVFYLSCVLLSIPVSLNPQLSAVRCIEWLDYVAVAVLWAAALKEKHPDRFMNRVGAIAERLCAFYIGLQFVSAMIHLSEVDFIEGMKSNSYSVACAVLMATTIGNNGLKPNRQFLVAVTGLVAFQSLTSVLAALVATLWLLLEARTIAPFAIYQRSRIVLLTIVVAIGLAVSPLAIEVINGVGHLMGRDEASITNLTGRSQLWGWLSAAIADHPADFTLGLGYGAGERIFVQNLSEANKQELAGVGIYDVAIHRHSHNMILAAIINIGYAGIIATFLVYFASLMFPTIANPADSRTMFALVLVAAVHATSTNLFASSDLVGLIYIMSSGASRMPSHFRQIVTRRVF